ncbi:MAG: thiamine ABC transporter ATP-binding protein [Inquilinaceae bacterium]
MPIVELTDVSFRYEDMRMRFDLSVEAGELLVVIGPSGAGKSTLLNLIAGFDMPERGLIVLQGRDMAGVPPARRPVTTLFQDHNLFAHLTVAQNVGLGIHPGLRLRPADLDRVADGLSQVGMAGFEERLPGQLSGGERQRAALARSLVRDRPILLLDEPFAALGPAQRTEMVTLVDRLRRDNGLTVLMVSHQLDEVRRLDGRAVFVQDGEILAHGRIRDFLESPPIPEIAAYLG